MFCFKVPGRMFVVFLAEIYETAYPLWCQGEFIWTIKTQTVHKIVAGFAIVYLG